MAPIRLRLSLLLVLACVYYVTDNAVRDKRASKSNGPGSRAQRMVKYRISNNHLFNSEQDMEERCAPEKVNYGWGKPQARPATKFIIHCGQTKIHNVIQPPCDKLMLKKQNLLKCDNCKAGNVSHCCQCSPCNCMVHCRHNTSSIDAFCTDKSLTEIPTTLPSSTTFLAICRTQINSFSVDNISMYKRLLHVIVSNTNLWRVRNSDASITTTALKILNLNNNNISKIEDNSFRLMPNLAKLKLRHNKLEVIRNLTFAGLKHLEILDMSYNMIKQIECGSFHHLTQLQILDLSQNVGLGYSNKTFPAELFVSLLSLQSLLIQGNSHANDTEYPNQIFIYLQNLESLYIDGLGQNVILGSEVKDLKDFRVLNIGTSSGKCYIQNISESFFKNVPRLQNLTLHNCSFHNVSQHTFSGLKEIKSLSLINIDQYNLSTALSGLEGLQNSSLETLRLKYLNKKCHSLHGKQVKYLNKLNLKELDLSGNHLIVLSGDFLQGLPHTLKNLILKENRLVRDDYLLSNIAHLIHLTCLDLSNQTDIFQNSHLLPRTKTPYFLKTEEIQSKSITKTYSASALSNTGKLSEYRKVCYDFVQMQNWSWGPVSRNSNSSQLLAEINLPVSLKILLASNYPYLGTFFFQYNISRNNSLRHIDFSHSFTHPRLESVLPKGISWFRLNGNNLKFIRGNLFPKQNSLKYLFLKSNNLGNNLAKIKNSTFQHLRSIIYLDLSYNNIYKLLPNLFNSTHKLETLDLSNNRLGVLNMSFSGLQNLQYLMLSSNSITSITKQTRKDLDNIASLHPLYIDISNNPLLCTCEGIDIIIWMETTEVLFISDHNMTCIRENGEEILLDDIEIMSQYLRRYCVSKAFIIASCVTAILVFSFLIVLGGLYRHRWKLRYLQYIALARCLGYKSKAINDNGGYRFDAYILYEYSSRNFVLQDFQQELEVKRGHKLCIADRDFIPGTYEVSAIVSAIQSSRKTVPVITTTFYNETYSEYAIKMAIMEEVHTHRSVLHLCLYQPLASDEMSKCHDLLMVMNRNHYTEFPPENVASVEVRQYFWDQLSQAIGHCENPGMPSSFGD